jgi:hypothetical protein
MIMPADTERLTAAIGRRVRTFAARFRRPAKPKGVIRVEIRPMARDPDLPDPELCGVPTGRVDCAGVMKERPNKRGVSPEHAEAMQACLPIGPSCC